MNPTAILDCVSLFFSGMLAGMEFVIHYGVRDATLVLDDQAQLQLRQALVLRLRVLIPAFFLPALLSGIVITVQDGSTPGWWLRGASLLAMLIWILLRVIGTVPINSATLAWKSSAPPKNWQTLVARAERFHIVGVWAVVMAFVCLLAAFALTLQAH